MQLKRRIERLEALRHSGHSSESLSVVRARIFSQLGEFIKGARLPDRTPTTPDGIACRTRILRAFDDIRINEEIFHGQ
jgi:hypothetical protein